MYQANIYEDSIIVKRILAGSVEVLKNKCKGYIFAQNITSIEVVELKNVGYFKLPKQIEKVIEKDLML